MWRLIHYKRWEMNLIEFMLHDFGMETAKLCIHSGDKS